MVTGAGIRLVVIQGEADPFGSPDEVRAALGASAEVMSARGSHSFTKTPADVLETARTFLSVVLVPLEESSPVPPPQLVGSPDQEGERQNQQDLP